jgi:hypothetical protein
MRDFHPLPVLLVWLCGGQVTKSSSQAELQDALKKPNMRILLAEDNAINMKVRRMAKHLRGLNFSANLGEELQGGSLVLRWPE